jgi:N-acetyllactosaminide beta-1,3-N-acetylglucosaminyltransferase
MIKFNFFSVETLLSFLFVFQQSPPCRLRNFSIVSVLALTISNVFLTLRLLQSSDCGQHVNNEPSALVPKSPYIFTPPPCLEYIMTDGNVSEKAIFSALNLQLGRWDQRRMYKVFDFVIHGEKFTELSEKLNVTLATQSSIEKIFSLVQGKCRFGCYYDFCIIYFFPPTTPHSIVSHHWTGAISVAGNIN